MSDAGVPLLVDTNAFVAAFDEDDSHHEAAAAVLAGIRDGNLPYGPLFTSRFVMVETAETLLMGVDHDAVVTALSTIRDSPSVNVLSVGPRLFDRTVAQFERYDDQSISLVDHMKAVLADEHDVKHVFAFDDDFSTLGLIRVPVDTGEA
ncbi:MAG: PIN domain-containing protein [Halobacteriales archaeon]